MKILRPLNVRVDSHGSRMARPVQAGAARRPHLRRRGRQAFAARASTLDEPDFGSLSLPRPKKPSQLQPSLFLGREGALEAQLKALKNNNIPHNDAGIEVLYRFAGFDPFQRCTYFNASLDLGQFERFRRIFYTPYYVPLLGLESWEVTSTLEVSESQWAARVHVVNAYRREQRDYTFHMEQRFGGKYDGVWYCSRLIADGCTPQTLYGVI